jgi:hypothetical protein
MADDDLLSRLKHFLFDNPKGKDSTVANANAFVKSDQAAKKAIASSTSPFRNPNQSTTAGMNTNGGVGNSPYGPPSGVSSSGSQFPGMFNNPATGDSRNINEAMGILNNPYVTTPSAQSKASSTLQGYGLSSGPNFPEQSPYEKLAEQLATQIQGIQSQATPLDKLREMAQGQVNSQYDPVISALQGEMGRTQDRAGTNQADARNMYNALGSNMESEIPGMQQQNQAAQDQSTQQYNDAAAKMQQGYQSQAAQQQAIMSRLGIEAATGDPRVQQTANDQQYFQNQNSTDAQHQRDMLAQIGAADQGFQQNMASNSRLAGENTAQDIGRQLEQYLGQAGDKLTGLQQQKGMDFTNVLNQLQQQDTQNVQTQSNNAFNQAMAMNNFQLNAMNSGNQQTNSENELALKLQELQQKIAGDSSAMGKTSGMSGVSNFLGQQYGQDVNKASQLENILGQVLNSPDVVKGKVSGGKVNGMDTMVDMTPEYVMQQLRNLAQQQGIQGGDINNLMDAYLAYKGQLR